VVVESLKVLDPKWPIREADIAQCSRHVRFVPTTGLTRCTIVTAPPNS
jgi:hypothetical protein